MLNRRHLRMKVMQALYGLEQARAATFQLCIDQINHAFDPDWNDERSEALTAERAAKTKQTRDIFREHYENRSWLDTTVDSDVRRMAQRYIKEYHETMDAERKGFQNGLLRDVYRLYDNYLLTLALPKSLAACVDADRELLRNSYLKKDNRKGDYKFKDNKIVAFLKTFEPLQLELKKRNLSWVDYEDEIREFYRSVVRNDKTYQQYNQSTLVTFEEERELVAHIFRHLVFTQQNLIYFSLKEFEIKRFALEARTREQGREQLKLQIIKVTTDILQAKALQLGIAPETILNWAEDLQKHLREAAQNIIKLQEKARTAEKDAEKDPREREREKPRINEGRTEERIFIDQVRQMHALLREAAQTLVGKLSTCLEAAEQNILDKQKTNIDFIEEGLHTLLSTFGLGDHPQDKITLQMENEKGASILQDLFQRLDYNWEENSKVVQNMVMKTMKMFDAPTPSQFALIDLSANWDEDKDFFMDLFRYSLEHEKEAERLLAQKSQNWEVSRMVGLDRIIMQMAIAEMMTFPSIPVKVTINEYLEIAKIYSTPRSKQFINGMLDQVANAMQTEGLIRKSGRGLIDNK